MTTGEETLRRVPVWAPAGPVEAFEATVTEVGTQLIVRIDGQEVARGWATPPRLELTVSPEAAVDLGAALVTGGWRTVRSVRWVEQLRPEEQQVFDDLGFAFWRRFERVAIERVAFDVGERVTVLGVPRFVARGTYRDSARRVDQLDVRVLRGRPWQMLATDTPRARPRSLAHRLGCVVGGATRLIRSLGPTLGYGLLLLWILRRIGGG